jgi:hypothetical protein
MNRVLAAMATLATLVLVSGCGGSHHAASLPGLTAAKLAKLTASVRRDATLNGDPHPLSATVYASRHHEAVLATMADGVPGDQPVYVVVIRGQFVCSGCSSPGPIGATGAQGSNQPHGNTITDVVDRRTLKELDWGIGTRVDTSKLGPGVPIATGRS